MRNTLPKSGPFLLLHPVYVPPDVAFKNYILPYNAFVCFVRYMIHKNDFFLYKILVEIFFFKYRRRLISVKQKHDCNEPQTSKGYFISLLVKDEFETECCLCQRSLGKVRCCKTLRNLNLPYSQLYLYKTNISGVKFQAAPCVFLSSNKFRMLNVYILKSVQMSYHNQHSTFFIYIYIRVSVHLYCDFFLITTNKLQQLFLIIYF